MKNLGLREDKELASGDSASQGQAPGFCPGQPHHCTSGAGTLGAAESAPGVSGERCGLGEERVTEYLFPISDYANQSTQLNLECLKKK